LSDQLDWVLVRVPQPIIEPSLVVPHSFCQLRPFFQVLAQNSCVLVNGLIFNVAIEMMGLIPHFCAFLLGALAYQVLLIVSGRRPNAVATAIDILHHVFGLLLLRVVAAGTPSLSPFFLSMTGSEVGD